MQRQPSARVGQAKNLDFLPLQNLSSKLEIRRKSQRPAHARSCRTSIVDGIQPCETWRSRGDTGIPFRFVFGIKLKRLCKKCGSSLPMSKKLRVFLFRVNRSVNEFFIARECELELTGVR